MAANRILIAESEPYNAQRLEQAFHRDGHETLVVHTGEQAWEICRRQLPQAVLIDTDLPDLDGYEILRRIRDSLRTRHIHVILLAAGNERRDKIAGLEMGADDYITKPYDIEEVRLRVRNALLRANVGNLVNPATNLPGNRLIQEQLRELLRRQDDWALIRVVLSHLDEFADAHGFLAGEDVLRTTAQILTEALDQWGSPDDFIGHSGGDEFILITSTDAAAHILPSLAQQLESIGRIHYTPDERERGFVTLRQSDGSEVQAPLLQADVQIVTAQDGPFHDIMQLTSALG